MAVYKITKTDDGGFGSQSLRDAIIQANSSPEDDTIELNSDEIYTLSIEGTGEDGALTGDLDIDGRGGQLTITGLGQGATIDAQNIDRVFDILEDTSTRDDVDTSANLVLENLTITGGIAPGARVFDDRGGGIHVENGATLTGNNIIVTNNTSATSNGRGGGIHNDGLLILNQARISNNRAADGGGIFNNYAVAQITDTVVTGNIASQPDNIAGDIGIGGGILHEGSGYLNLNDSSVRNNTAGFRGGGIANEESLGSVVGSININNSVITGNTSAEGGGINNQGEMTIDNSSVRENYSSRSGGGISAAPDLNTDNKLTITNSTISENLANGSGGGIYNDSLGNTYVYFSDIQENTALGNGGGVGGQFSGAIVISSTISNNQAGGDGGGLDKIRILSNSTVENNTAQGNGGGISSTRVNSIIKNSTINNNTAANFGGGLHIGTGGTQDYTATIVNSTITGNIANNGAGISVYSGVVINGSYDYNSNTYTYTSVQSFPGNAKIVNTTITNNIADPDNEGNGNAGGIWQQPFGFGFVPGEVNLANTIVAENFDTPNNAGEGEIFPNIYGPIRGNNNNLVGNLDGVVEVILEPEQTLGGDEDLISDNPRLGPLDDYGGDTKTIALLPDSPAIDAGANNALTPDILDLDGDEDREEVEVFDQRHDDQNNDGFARVVNGRVDIGAFELDPTQPLADDNDNRLTGTDEDDVINGRDGDDTINGGQGNDQLTGSRGRDRLFGNVGNDTLDGGLGSDLIEGGEGNDVLIGKDGDDTLDGGSGDDTMRGSDGNDYYMLDSVRDVVENEKPDADGGIDTIESSVSIALGPSGRNIENLIVDDTRFIAGIGNLLDNVITGTNSKNRLSGGTGDDTVDGGRQEDRLLGNGGNDILIGSFGDDLLEGGQGRDRFQFERIDERLGIDTIVDFNPGADFIVFQQTNFDGINDSGAIDDDQLLIVDNLNDASDDFTQGFIYATNDGSLAYIDSENRVDLTQFAILRNQPAIEANNILFL